MSSPPKVSYNLGEEFCSSAILPEFGGISVSFFLFSSASFSSCTGGCKMATVDSLGFGDE